MTTPDGVQITGDNGERYDEVLTTPALALLADLHRTFDLRRLEPLQTRQDRYQELAARGTLDFLPEMLERTTRAAREAGLGNVETLEAEIEEIPLPDASVDVVISNGVVNLSPRKARVLAECARVLRPGGELCVSDLTVDEDDLPPEILTHPAAWAG